MSNEKGLCLRRENFLKSIEVDAVLFRVGKVDT